ncbi:ABC transporter permease [Paenarthrobacter sp. TYUT067]|uniref:ABC transporter permease n=1 Tax=Paenarthrobacter sp. TYUT067 TaxID=2926245 RepID=UPI00202DBA3A|nr:ABC transporter permease [Paenarthrobacter sp. TYUT067]MCM0614434.1 ABC transporter permease [Paenarthrobacter sp. TYUT067]
MNDSRVPRLLWWDIVRLGSSGLRTRPMRSVLSALGIAIGIAAMIAVVGISTSSQARLNEQFAQLGTNLLTVTPGKSLAGKETPLPSDAVQRVRRMAGVERVSSISEIKNVNVFRNDLSDPRSTGGLIVYAADLELLDAVGADLYSGKWLDAASGRYPTVVLGSKAASRLGIATPGGQVFLGGKYFTVMGILKPVPLAPELDTAALVGIHAARDSLNHEGEPTTVYERSAEQLVEQVRKLLPASTKPEAPNEVNVSRPSDALAAKYATDQAFTGMLVGLGSVALLVGGIGVANTMIISVLERRKEIGLRRSLGATKSHIRGQFLTEAVLLSALGGLAGAFLGFGVTAVFALSNGWLLSIPLSVFPIAIGATVAIGAFAGLYPAIRAARLPPTSALNA